MGREPATVSLSPGAPMTELAVDTRGLRKTYRRRGGGSVGVEGLDLRVPVGGVHGFLGPNGSGKTTTIRMLLGLIRPDAGTMQIFGHDVPAQLPAVIGRVGAIVESPKFFPTFTARRNLELLAGAIGAPREKVSEVLAATALSDRSRDRYKTYSLGMKQRLAIAATLLKSPDLLIFDEPTNGLDPGGIREVRDTMRRLAAEGRTVLVSSHILAEVQQVADTVSIIGRGRLLAEGKVADVINQRGGGAVRVGVADPARAEQILSAAGLRVRSEAGSLRVRGAEDPAHITELLAAQGLYVNELSPERMDLERVFLDLTTGEGLEGPTSGRHAGRPPGPRSGSGEQS